MGNGWDDTIDAYIRNCLKMERDILGFQQNHFTLEWQKKKLNINSLCELGEKVKILFAVGDDVNDIVYSATVMEIVSGRDAVASR